jgi:hypothetical protein
MLCTRSTRREAHWLDCLLTQCCLILRCRIRHDRAEHDAVPPVEPSESKTFGACSSRFPVPESEVRRTAI